MYYWILCKKSSSTFILPKHTIHYLSIQLNYYTTFSACMLSVTRILLPTHTIPHDWVKFKKNTLTHLPQTRLTFVGDIGTLQVCDARATKTIIFPYLEIWSTRTYVTTIIITTETGNNLIMAHAGNRVGVLLCLVVMCLSFMFVDHKFVWILS